MISKRIALRRLLSALVATTAICGCVDNAPVALSQGSEKGGAIADQQTQDIVLYDKRPLEPWHVVLKNAQQEKIFNGRSAQLNNDSARLITADKDVQDDALTYSFQDSWFYSLYFAGGEPLDLSAFLPAGTVEFAIKVDDIEQGAMDLAISCGQDCVSKVRLREWAQTVEGKGWQHLAIPLHCFVKPGAKFAAVMQPFSLETGGKGQVNIADIRFKVSAAGNFHCPERNKLAITPAILNEYWSVDWWLPRHLEKVAQAQLGQAELLLIGDSITHGWENTGQQVWQQYFAPINTLNIGYSGDRTENVLWRLEHDEVKGIDPKLTVLMIGTNNTGHRMDNPAYIAAGVEKILRQLSQRLPNTKVLLLAIFPRGEDNRDPMRQNNQQSNLLLKQLAKKHQAIFANFNQGFLDEKGSLSTDIMPDLLHPNEAGYIIWAEQLKPYIDKYVQ